MTVAFSTDELYSAHQPPGGAPHPERPERLAAILEQLDRGGLLARMQRLAPRDATDEELLAVHDRALLEAVDAHAEAGGGWIDADTFVAPSSPAAARRAAGAALAATEAVLDSGARTEQRRARSSPPGPPGHHATHDRAMGFCLYNQVAVAAAAALARGVERVAVVDWDLHHGNGTQAIFDAEPRLLYVSTHASPTTPAAAPSRSADAAPPPARRSTSRCPTAPATPPSAQPTNGWRCRPSSGSSPRSCSSPAAGTRTPATRSARSPSPRRATRPSRG